MKPGFSTFLEIDLPFPTRGNRTSLNEPSSNDTCWDCSYVYVYNKVYSQFNHMT